MINRTTILLLWSVLLSTTFAQSIEDVGPDVNLNDPEFRDTIRSVQANSSEVPSGVAFNSILQFVALLVSEDPVIANGWVQQQMGVDATEAEALVGLFNSTQKAISTEIDQNTVEVACPNGAPSAYGDATYSVLESMDDNAEQIMENHLSRVKELLGSAKAARLQQWVDDQKQDTVHVKFDHRKLSERISVSGYDRLLRVCMEPPAAQDASSSQ